MRNDDEIWEKIEEIDWSKRHNTRRYSPSSLLHPPSSKYSSTIPLPMEGPEAPTPRRGLIILVEFQNKQFREENDRVMFDRIANEKGFSERGFKGCVSDYFRDQSNGMLDLTFDVIGPVTINNDFEELSSVKHLLREYCICLGCDQQLTQRIVVAAAFHPMRGAMLHATLLRIVPV